MKAYVLGYAWYIRNRIPYLILIKKTHPEPMNGLLNGIGGQIEFRENSLDAMIREFREETGVQTQKRDWVSLGRHILPCFADHGKDCDIFVLATQITLDQAHQVHSTTEEEVIALPLSEVKLDQMVESPWFEKVLAHISSRP